MREEIRVGDRVVWTDASGKLRYGKVSRMPAFIVAPEDSPALIDIDPAILSRMVPLEEITQEARAESADAAVHLELATLQLRAAEARLTPTSGIATMLTDLASELLELATGMPSPASTAIVRVARKLIEAVE